MRGVQAAACLKEGGAGRFRARAAVSPVARSSASAVGDAVAVGVGVQIVRDAVAVRVDRAAR